MDQSAVRALVAPPRLFSSLRQKRYKTFPSISTCREKNFRNKKKSPPPPQDFLKLFLKSY